jgi:hypothetical protein
MRLSLFETAMIFPFWMTTSSARGSFGSIVMTFALNKIRSGTNTPSYLINLLGWIGKIVLFMLNYYDDIGRKSTFRLPNLKAGTCLRLERSTELKPKSQAESSRLTLSCAFSPSLKGGLDAAERVKSLRGNNRVI